MNYYPLIDINGLIGEVTLCNFSPSTSNMPNEAAICFSAFSDGQKWNITKQAELPPGQTLTLNRQNMKGEGPDNSIFFFMYPEALPDSLDALPHSSFQTSRPA